MEIPDPTPRKLPIVKAHFVGPSTTPLSNITEDGGTAFQGTGAVAPPYDPNELAGLFEISGCLRTNIDAYAANIDGHGHSFEPVLDLQDEGAWEVMRQAIVEERIYQSLAQRGLAETATDLLAAWTGGDSKVDTEVSDKEIEERIEDLQRVMAAERRSLEFFFDNCTTEFSFNKLRRAHRQEYEIFGNGYWEVLRNDQGEPAQFNLLPSCNVRLLPRLPAIDVERPVSRSLFHHDTLRQSRSFRLFVQITATAVRSRGRQISGENVVYFKEYGDPRVVSAVTGQCFDTVEALTAAEPKARPATEILHFKIHSSRSPYGIPRWISELISVLGSRHADQVNFLYFENKSIPPLAILVSGGSLAPESVTEIRNYINNEIRGAQNFHKIMILEATSGDGLGGENGSVKVEIKPLTQAIQQDAMFLEYLRHNRDSVGMVFRNPRIVRGDTNDMNRSTADAAILLAEQQVYEPERKDFDWVMNREILPSLHIRFWRFVSRGPNTTDPSELVKMLQEAAESGYLTIAELRRIAERAFGVTLSVFNSWTNNVPLAVIRLHQSSLKDGGVAGLEQEMEAPERPDLEDESIPPKDETPEGDESNETDDEESVVEKVDLARRKAVAARMLAHVKSM